MALGLNHQQWFKSVDWAIRCCDLSINHKYKGSSLNAFKNEHMVLGHYTWVGSVVSIKFPHLWVLLLCLLKVIAYLRQTSKSSASPFYHTFPLVSLYFPQLFHIIVSPCFSQFVSSFSQFFFSLADPFQEDWPLVLLAAAEAICDLSEALRRAMDFDLFWPTEQWLRFTPVADDYLRDDTNQWDCDNNYQGWLFPPIWEQ